MGHKFPQRRAYLLGFNFHFTVIKSSVLFGKYLSVTAELFQVSPFLLTKLSDCHLWHHTRFVTALLLQRSWDLVKIHFCLPVIRVPSLYD